MFRAKTGSRFLLRGARKGQVIAMVTLALMVLLSFAGLTLDVGLSVLGCQQCQTIADAGALAGVQEWRDPAMAQFVAWYTARANLPKEGREAYTVHVQYYNEGDSLPSGEVAPRGGALDVTASKWVRYQFLRVLGKEGLRVTRTATATRFLTGTCIAPIWIWYTTPVSYGEQINLLMADGPHCGVPGSFGFLQPAGDVPFEDAIKGTLTLDQEEEQRVKENDFVWAKTGLAVAHWRGPLKTDWDSRLNRAAGQPWSSDTYGSFKADNPRILIVPFVEYIEGTGSGAYFKVHKFGAFWLEDVITNGNDRYIQGRFIDFMKPGGKIFGLNPGRLAG